jgi:hypothetical protein
MTETNETEDPASTFDQHIARIAVGGYDDMQQVRKSLYNRIRDIVRKKNEGIAFDEVEDEKEDKSYDEKYADENLPNLIEQMYAEGTLSEHEKQYIKKLLKGAEAAVEAEESYADTFEITEREPVYREWLQHVYGVSSTLTARLIHDIGYCEDFDRVSELWSYCGLAPGQERKKGEKLGYNPTAKKDAWLVADCMMKGGDRSRYRVEFFDPYKQKQLRRMNQAEEMTDAQLEKKEWTPPKSQGHAHNRAMRYLAKKFLKHYWAIAREIKGHDTPDEYIIAHGGHKKQTETWENPFHAKRQLLARAEGKDIAKAVADGGETDD